MKQSKLWAVVCLCVVAATGCAGESKCREATPVKVEEMSQAGAGLPGEMVELLRAGKVLRTRLYLGERGELVKTAFYVEASSMPAWVMEQAEAELGAPGGADDVYEVEYYAVHGLVYEAKRTVEGRAREVSFKADRSVLYVERELGREELPAPAQEEIGRVEATGARLTYVSRIEYTGGEVKHQAKVMRGERQERLWFDAQGALTARSVEAPGRVEIVGGK